MYSPDLHCLDRHKEHLKTLCRLCGQRLKKVTSQARMCMVSNNAHRIKSAYGISVLKDKPDVHPVKFCFTCFNFIREYEQNKLSQSTISNKASTVLDC